MLTRFDPFRDVDRLLEELGQHRGQSARTMPLDIARGPDRYVVRADLPGVTPESLDLSVEGNVLTIRADRQTTEDTDMQVLASERPNGSFVRQLTIGEGFDMEHVSADYSWGVLTVILPVAETSKPRRIAVNAGVGERSINATATGATT